MNKSNSEKRDITRVSVVLDKETEKILDTLVNTEGKTVSGIIREALVTYFELKMSSENLDLRKLKRYNEILHCEEHVLIDIELWITILEELSKKGSKGFIEFVEKMGYNQGLQNRNMGLNDIYSSLKYLEIKNWFKVKKNGKGSCTIVLSTRSERDIVRAFLENMFKAQEISIEILGGIKELLVVKKDECKTPETIE